MPEMFYFLMDNVWLKAYNPAFDPGVVTTSWIRLK